MDDIQKLLTENLIEALKQIQNYLVLALGASVSAIALAFKPDQGREDGVTVPVISLPLPRSAAHGILWVLAMIGGFMAGAAAHRANVIALKLTTIPGLLSAVGSFPSLATFPEQVVRLIPLLLTPVLSAVAVCWQLRREKAPATAMAIMLIFLGAAYVPLWVEMSRLSRTLGAP